MTKSMSVSTRDAVWYQKKAVYRIILCLERGIIYFQLCKQYIIREQCTL